MTYNVLSGTLSLYTTTTIQLHSCKSAYLTYLLNLLTYPDGVCNQGKQHLKRRIFRRLRKMHSDVALHDMLRQTVPNTSCI